MPMEPEDIEEMKGLIAVARKRPLAFGLCLGKSPEGTVFTLHRLKEGEVLARSAKKQGETAKVTHGTAEVKGKVLTLTCNGDVIAGMSKNLKRFLKANDMGLKVIALDPSGALADDDGEPEEEEGAAAPASPGPGAAAPAEADKAQGADAANWEKVAPAMAALVARAVASGAEKAAQIDTAWKAAEAAAAKGRHADALAVAARIRPLLAAAGPGAPAPAAASPAAQAATAEGATGESPDARRWAAIEPAIVTLYEKAMGLNPQDRSQLSAAWVLATEKAGAGDHAGALQIVARLKPKLDAVIAAGVGGTEQEVPKDVVPFQKSRVLWRATKSNMMKEMARLESAIVEACAGDAELAPVAAEASQLSKRLEVFDARLEEVLDQITNTAEGPARTALKQQAKIALKDYRDALASDFFLDVDNENGFESVAVAASARKALDAIATVLG